MQDVVQQIVATEGEARRAVETARGEGNRIVSEARKKGQEIIEQARLEVFAEARVVVEAAEESAEREKQNRLAEAVTQIENEIQLDPARKEWAVKEVVRCVCGQP